jgi:flagellar hook-basal body complex protein FliE
MPAPIVPVSSAAIAESVRTVRDSAGGAGFGEVLANAIGSVETASRGASASVQRFLSGEGQELHTTIMATQRAELAFEMFLQVRNKVVSAYQEIMRMPM